MLIVDVAPAARRAYPPAAADSPPAGPVRRSRPGWGLRLRVLAILAISAAPWYFPVLNVGAELAAGSRAVLFIVVAVLAWILAASTEPPGGVVDSEVNWIVAAIGGAGVFAAIALLADRVPTLAQLWRFDMLGPVVWTAVVTSVFLGVRYVGRLWDLWVFLLACASPLPFLLVSGWFGGSDLSLAVLASVVATIVVVRATRRYGLRSRGVAGASCLGIGLAACWLVLNQVSDSRIGLLVAVAIGAGVVPVVVISVLRRVVGMGAAGARDSAVAGLPEFSMISAAAMLAVSMVLMVVSPTPPSDPVPPRVAGDWAQGSGLRPSHTYTVAENLLGPQVSYTRYSGSDRSVPASAVDVITAPTRGALQDFADAIWYPSAEPVDYRPVELDGLESMAMRSAHSNADIAVDPTVAQWYALTWVWQVQDGFQQVIVVVSQDEQGQLPDPVRVSLSQTVVAPLLWIARQQPRQDSKVAAETVELAQRLARRVVTAAGLADADGRPAMGAEQLSAAREDG